MARLWRWVREPGRRTSGRLRQLGSLLTSTVACGIDGLLLRYFRFRYVLCNEYIELLWDWIMWSFICKTIMVCNEWCVVISIYYVSQKQYSWDCDVRHNRHLVLKIRVLTRGFLAGCRPFICLDGCHIKTRNKGQLLTAVGVDPNDCIYPIAFGLVEVECTSSWEWFLTNLKEDLNITNTAPWTIMSDKQKVTWCSLFFYVMFSIFYLMFCTMCISQIHNNWSSHFSFV